MNKTRGQKISESKRMSLEDFISRANKKHNNLYIYDNVVYTNAHTHVKITCKEHGDWMQTPMDHLNGGYGCPKCGNIKKGISKSMAAFKKFLNYASEKHSHKYTYKEDSFLGMTKPMTIVCPIHGEFQQTPDVHKRAGCQRCGSGPVSLSSQLWLDSLNVEKCNREVWIFIDGKRIKVDGFDPSTNTIYEFWGDYWHGNPNVYNADDLNSHNKQKFGDLFNSTVNRIKLIENAGYTLTHIWESDWINSDK